MGSTPSSCGSVRRSAVASATRDPRFESSHRQIFCQTHWNDQKLKKKRLGIVQFLSKNCALNHLQPFNLMKSFCFLQEPATLYNNLCPPNRISNQKQKVCQNFCLRYRDTLFSIIFISTQKTFPHCRGSLSLCLIFNFLQLLVSRELQTNKK